MRPVLVRLHRWLGVATALFLFVSGLTGALIAWDHEIDALLNPTFFHARTDGPALPPLELARRVEAADPRGFAVIERYVREEHEALGRAVTKLAIVRPDGLLGAITAGFFGVTPPPYPVEVFDDRRRAVEWLGESGAVLDEIATEEERATGTPPLLRDLRALLEKKLGDDPSLATVAKTLGLSERSLQRKLGEHDTTFQGEVNAARVRAAKRLLRDTNASLTQIAFDVGCASLASFSALFRRATGTTPSAWRQRKV